MNPWLSRALYLIQSDVKRSSDTHLIKVELPALKKISLYLKDESTHPTGSLKHRLARSLFLYGLCNGQIKEGTTIVESSSGNTAVSEAYFAQLLGLPFIAVIPEGTSQEKIVTLAFTTANVAALTPQQSTPKRLESPKNWTATTWTSSPTQNGPRIGGATITLLSPSMNK